MHYSAPHHLSLCCSAAGSSWKCSVLSLCSDSDHTAHKHNHLQSKVRKGWVSVGQKYSLPVCFTRIQNRPKLRAHIGTFLNLGHWNQWRFCEKLSIIHGFFQCWLCRRTFMKKHCHTCHNFYSPRLVREDADLLLWERCCFSVLSVSAGWCCECSCCSEA